EKNILGNVALSPPAEKEDILANVGAQFIIDVCRHIENWFDASALRSKYGLTNDADYDALAENEKLQLAIGAAKERRIRDGTAAQEKAAHYFTQAPDVLNSILRDPAASPRHKIESARELRQVAIPASEIAGKNKEKFVININFGTAKISKEIELKPKPETLTIEAGHNEAEDGEFGF